MTNWLNPSETRVWFAWRPVRTGDGGWKWFTFVIADRYGRIIPQFGNGMAYQSVWCYWASTEGRKSAHDLLRSEGN